MIINYTEYVSKSLNHSLLFLIKDLISCKPRSKTQICKTTKPDPYSQTKSESPCNSNNNNNDSHENIMSKFYVSDTVVNLSDHTLTEAQCKLLSKGLKFCPTLGEQNQGDLWRDLQNYHRGLRRTIALNKFKIVRPEQNEFTFEQALSLIDNEPLETGFTDQCKPFRNQKFKLKSKWNPPGPKDLEHYIAKNELLLSQTKPHESKYHNLTKAEKNAIQELKNCNDIIIKPADKGAACVIMNTSDYKKEANRQLLDAKYYVKCKTDLTAKHATEVNDLVQKMHEQGEISSETKDYLSLDSDSTRTARFYMLPKIHKNKLPPPGRPIVSGNGCPTEKISEFVDFFLNPLSKQFPSYIKDTNHFLQILGKHKNVPKGAFLFTLDIESLYTNIRHNVGIRFVQLALDKLRPTNELPKNDSILLMLEAILTKNNFSFNDEHYLQIAGTAMGTKTAPSYANIVVAIYELLYVYSYQLQPICWYRFIDDIFGIWPHGIEEFNKFVEYLNSKVEGIKFVAHHSHSEISFLDTLVLLTETGSINTSIYRKPTDTYNYILYNSAHPTSCKKGIPYGQFLRIRRICTNLQDFEHHANEMADAFIQRGYPKQLVTDSLIKAKSMNRKHLLDNAKQAQTEELEKIFLIQTYNPGNNPLQELISSNWNYLQQNPHLKVFRNCKLIVANRRPPNLRDILTKATFSEKCPRLKNTKAKCSKGTNCRYCTKLSTCGRITSKVTGRSYVAKTNVTCQSNNLIYCIECKTCGVQYVGETYRRLMDRFQGHYSNIRNKNPNSDSLIRAHFNQSDHNGLQDLTIHILDFIHMAPKSIRTRNLRRKIEQNWIHRLKTVFPSGLNLDT